MHCSRKIFKMQLFFILWIIFVLISGCNQPIPADQIIAKVGDEVLTRERIKKKMHWDGVRQDQEMEYVERWVDRQLLYLEARKHGIQENSQLEWEIELLKQEFFINQYLEKQYADNIHITREEIVVHYEQNKTDFLVEENEVRILHILTATRENANSVLQEIRVGKAFEKVAEEWSIDEFKAYGGEVGFIKKGDVINVVSREAFRLNVDGISRIIKSDFGFHIIKVLEKRSKGDFKPIPEVEKDIRARLIVKKKGDLYYDILYKLRNQTKVAITNPYVLKTFSDKVD